MQWLLDRRITESRITSSVRHPQRSRFDVIPHRRARTPADQTLARRSRRPRSIYFGVAIALGSAAGVGETAGEGVGTAKGVRTVPLLVVSTPPDSATSSTKYNSPLLTTFFP